MAPHISVLSCEQMRLNGCTSPRHNTHTMSQSGRYDQCLAPLSFTSLPFWRRGLLTNSLSLVHSFLLGGPSTPFIFGLHFVNKLVDVMIIRTWQTSLSRGLFVCPHPERREEGILPTSFSDHVPLVTHPLNPTRAINQFIPF